MTTAFSLLVNCLSPLPAIFQFGLCGGLLILINFGLVLVYMPALLVLEERGLFACGPLRRACLGWCPSRLAWLLGGRPLRASGPRGEPSKSVRGRLVHAVHSALHRSSSALLLGFVCAACALLPSAVALLGHRQGEEFQVFGTRDERWPERLTWLGAATSSGSVAQRLAAVVQPEWPNLYKRVAFFTGSYAYRAPTLAFALWPTGASLLATLLIVDALALVAPVALRFHANVHRGGKLLTRRGIGLLLLGCTFSLCAGFVLSYQADETHALNNLGCSFPKLLNTALAVGLFLHSLVFSAIAAVYLTKLFHRCCAASWWTADSSQPRQSRLAKHRRRVCKGRLFAALAVLSLLTTALVVHLMSQPVDDDDADRFALRPPPSPPPALGDWSPTGPGLGLIALLVGWAMSASGASVAHMENTTIMHCLPTGRTEASRHKRGLLLQLAYSILLGLALLMYMLHGFEYIVPQSMVLAMLTTILLASGVALLFPTVAICTKRRVLIFSPHSGRPQTSAGKYAFPLACAACWALGIWTHISSSRVASAPPPPPSADDGDVHIWRASPLGFGLSGLLVLWSVAPGLSSMSAFCMRPIGPFLDISLEGLRYWTPVAATYVFVRTIGMAILAFTGVAVAVALPVVTGFESIVSSEATRSAFGSCLVLTAAFPLLHAYVVVSDKPWKGLLRPTPLARKHPLKVATIELYTAALLVIGAMQVLRLSAEPLDTHAAVLGLLWLFDAVFCFVVSEVVAVGVPFGFIRPVTGSVRVAADANIRTAASTRQRDAMVLFAFGFVAFLVLGIATLVIAGWSSARLFLYGVDGAAYTLGAMLLVHGVVGAQATGVFCTGVPWYIFQPLRGSQGGWPTAVGLALTMGCFVGGLALIFATSGVVFTLKAQRREPTSREYASPWEDWDGTFDGLSLALFALLACEAVLLAAAATVQAASTADAVHARPRSARGGEQRRAAAHAGAAPVAAAEGAVQRDASGVPAPLWRVRPLVPHADTTTAAAAVLGLMGGSLLAAIAAVACVFTAFSPSSADAAWVSRVLPVAGEAVAMAHAAGCIAASRKMTAKIKQRASQSRSVAAGHAGESHGGSGGGGHGGAPATVATGADSGTEDSEVRVLGIIGTRTLNPRATLLVGYSCAGLGYVLPLLRSQDERAPREIYLEMLGAASLCGLYLHVLSESGLALIFRQAADARHAVLAGDLPVDTNGARGGERTDAAMAADAAQARARRIELASAKRREVRSALVAALLMSAGCGLGYTDALAGPALHIRGSVRGDGVRLDAGGGEPGTAIGELSSGTYAALVVLCALLLLHVPHLAIVAEVWCTGVPTLGFLPHYKLNRGVAVAAPSLAASTNVGVAAGVTPSRLSPQSEAPPRAAPTPSFTPTPRPKPLLALGVALLAMLCAASGCGVAYVAYAGASKASSAPPLRGLRVQAPVGSAEPCSLLWGVPSQLLHSAPGKQLDAHAAAGELAWLDPNGEAYSATVYEEFRPEQPSAQEELRLVCAFLRSSRATSPVLHTEHTPSCVIGDLHEQVTSGTLGNFTAWPLPEAQFVPALLALLRARPDHRWNVGFHADVGGYPSVEGAPPTRLAWIRVSVTSKYSNTGVLYSQPELVQAYKQEWDDWFGELPIAVRTPAGDAPASSLPLPQPAASILRYGFPTCTQHSLGPTLQAFLSGVARALVLTPAFSLLAMLVFLRDAFLCYAALYTIVAMVVTVLGLLHCLGLVLGPIESLSFALVVVSPTTTSRRSRMPPLHVRAHGDALPRRAAPPRCPATLSACCWLALRFL